MDLTLFALPGIPFIQVGDDLADILIQSARNRGLEILDNDIFIIAQKIISKSERRQVNLATIAPSQKAKRLAKLSNKDPRLCELIIQESNKILRIRPGTIIVQHKLGFVCANAGIDHSNVSSEGADDQNQVLLLPKNPDESAFNIRQNLENMTNRKLGTMIIDSHGRAWRLGVVGSCIGLSGMPGLVDMRGQPDLFGFKLRITTIAAADELAAAASLVMGQAAEGIPAILARGFPYSLREGMLKELMRPQEEDLFQ
jgi:coenzyme F420-0:L-glutamate ligase / coenzyme F420-1:gamma-L-glutamate ligase